MRSKKYDLEPMPQIIAQFPQSGMTREEWTVSLDRAMTDLLELYLPPAEFGSFQEWRLAPVGKPGVLRKLDATILRQAQTAGVRLTLSEIVLKRTIEWHGERDGPQKFLRLGKAFAHATLIFQGRIPPPLDDPTLYLTKQETVAELKVLLQKMRQRVDSRRSKNVPLLDLFFQIVTDKKEKFVALRRNQTRWYEFLRQEEIQLLLPNFVSGSKARRITPMNLFDAWMAWCKGAARGKSMDQETVRKRVSAMGKYC